MDPFRFYSYLRTFYTDDVASKIQLNKEDIATVISDVERLIRAVDTDFAPLKDAMDFLATDDPRFADGRYFIPARKFIIPVDSASLPDAVATGLVKKNLVEEVRFRIENDVIYKNSIAQLDMLATNNWERPIYFSNTVSNDNFLGLDDSFIQEGLAYRIAPVNAQSAQLFGVIDTGKMYRRMVEEFEWGGLDDPRVYMDENNTRMTIKYRYAYASLARAFSDEGNNGRAVEVLDYCMEHMPHERVPFNFSVVPLVQSYYAAGAVDKAVALTEQLETLTEEELSYLVEVIKAKPGKSVKLQPDFLQLIRDINSLSSIALGYGETDVARRLEEKVNTYIPVFEQYFR